VSRFHSKDPAAARWRAKRARIYADIEGLARDRELEAFVAELWAAGLEPEERIKRVKEYIKRKQHRAGS